MPRLQRPKKRAVVKDDGGPIGKASWTEESMKTLLKLFHEFKTNNKFPTDNGSHKHVYREMAIELNVMLGTDFNGQQVQDKIGNLKSRHRALSDKFSRSGAGKNKIRTLK